MSCPRPTPLAEALATIARLEGERDALIHDLERVKDSETYHLNRAERMEAALRQIAESNFIGRAEGYARAALEGADHE